VTVKNCQTQSMKQNLISDNP